MVSTTITFALDGDAVSLETFAEEMRHFSGLLRALAVELSRKDEIAWFIEDLQRSSAIATIRGEAEDIRAVERVVSGVIVVGKALARFEPVPYSPGVVKQAEKIVARLNGEIRSVRFETSDEDVTVYGPSVSKSTVTPTLSAYGAVEGRVQTLSSRGGLRFTLYDTLRDRAVSCYLQEGQQELMRGIWGQRALVEGWVTRDAVTGRPVTIRRVRNVELIPDVTPGSYRRARGALPRGPHDLPPEEAIRRLRDA